MRDAVLASLAAAALIGTGAPARAIDNLTGTYTGKLACRTYEPGEKPAKSKRDVTIEVVDNAQDPLVYLRISAGVAPIGETIHVSRYPDAKPDRVKLAGADCSFDVYSQTGVALQAEAAIPSGSEKGTLKGTLSRQTEAPPALEICTFSAKRTATEPPTGINVCFVPPPPIP
jgi:hypothetical protein